jgi:outer membrane receptor for ferrienterochelin and colicins
LAGCLTAAVLALPSLMAQAPRHAPAAVLLGSVRDSVGPLPGTQVMIRNSVLVAITDSLGHFEIRGIPPGQHGVVLEKIGYYHLELLDVDFGPPDTVGLEVRLIPRQFVVSECMVSPPC